MIRFCVSALIVSFVTCALAMGQAKYEVLYNFGTNPNDGTAPNGDLVFDKAGNLYGTTPFGGSVCSSECGTAFELSPSLNGSWTETIIYNFGSDNGASPHAGLLFDGSGNLYGTTVYGGTGYGIVFELSPPLAGGMWTETVLWTFGGPEDGSNPHGKLVWDDLGNLYGTTAFGGASGSGTIFELSPGLGGWTEKVLYTFCTAYPDCSDGAAPMAGATFDKFGNLYGTTSFGGASHGHGPGVVYELSPALGGGWTETTLHRFSSNNGEEPMSEVSFDRAGSLYGTVYQGARYGCGGVFQMIPKQGTWTEGTLPFDGNDACSPEAGLFIDNRTNSAFGTSQYGGEFNGGAAYELTHHDGVTTIHSFCSQSACQDGTQPGGALTLNAGKLYGTTAEGGTGTDSACGQLGCGVVFQLAP